MSLSRANMFAMLLTSLVAGQEELPLIHLTALSGGWDGGRAINHAIGLQVDQINSNPNILKDYKLVIDYTNSACNPDVAQDAALDWLFEGKVNQATMSPMPDPMTFTESVVTGKEYIGAIGAGCSGASMQIAPLLAKARKPQISHASTSPTLSDRDLYPYFWRTPVPDNVVAAQFSTVAKQLGFKKITMVVSAVAFSWVPSVAAGIEAQGLEVVGEDLTYLGQPGLNKGVYVSNEMTWEEAQQAAKLYKRNPARFIFALTYDPAARLMVCALWREGIRGFIFMYLGWWDKDWFTPEPSGTDVHPCTKEEMIEATRDFISADGLLWRDDNPVGGTTCWPGLDVQQFRKDVDAVTLAGTHGTANGYTATMMDAICMFALTLDKLIYQDGKSKADLMKMDAATFNLVQQHFAEIDFVGMSGGGTMTYPPANAAGVRGPDPTGSSVIEQQQNMEMLGVDQTKIRTRLALFTGSGDQWTGEPFRFRAYGETVTVVNNELVGVPIQEYKDCPEGETVDFETNTCVGCAEGEEYNTAFGGCQSCPAGDTGAAGGPGCEPCAPGTYQPDEGQLTCLKAQPGYFQSMAGRTEEIACPLGTEMPSEGAEECNPCEVGFFEDEEGSEACTQCPEGMTTKLLGARHSGDCGCATGSYLDTDGACVACGGGLDCQGFGTVPELIVGFTGTFKTMETVGDGTFMTALDAPEIFDCKIAKRCPGGALGTCSAGREGYACGRCMPKHYAESDGTCVPCKEAKFSGGAATVVLILIVLVLLTPMALTFSTDPKSVAMGAISSGVVLGMGISLIQVLQVFDMIAIDWGSPFTEMLQALSVIAFDLDLFKFECVAGTNPVSRYLSKVMTFPIIVAVYTGIVGLLWVVAKGKKLKNPISGKVLTPGIITWTNGIGTLSLVFFITLAIISAEPFQCVSHPSNEMQTVAKYMDILCNEGSHSGLVAIGFVGIFLFEVTILAAFSFAIIRYPTWIKRNEHRFLQRCRFLFVRFHSDYFWFTLPLLIRNLFLAFAPAMSENSAVQIVLIQVFLGCYLFVQHRFQPWRNKLLNDLDACLSLAFMLMITVSAVFVPWDDGMESTFNNIMQTVLMVPFILIICFLFGAVLRFAYVACKKGKKYELFLSHHKTSGGNTARLLHMILGNLIGHERVFLDADNLVELDTLLYTVQQDVKTLVVLLTDEVLWRPWCTGEIVMALSNNVNTMMCWMPGAQVDLSAAAGLVRQKIRDDAMQLLLPMDIGYDEVEALYAKLPALPSFELKITNTINDITGLCMEICNESAGKQGKAIAPKQGEPQSPSNAEVVVLVNEESMEALSCARIVGKMLADRSMLVYNTAESQAAHDLTAISHSSAVVIILTSGCMHNARIASNMVHANKKAKSCLGIFIDDSGFEVLNDKAYTDMLAGQFFPSAVWDEAQSLHQSPLALTDVQAAYERLFSTIGERLTPNGSTAILKAQIEGIQRKLERLKKGVSTPAYSPQKKPIAATPANDDAKPVAETPEVYV